MIVALVGLALASPRQERLCLKRERPAACLAVAETKTLAWPLEGRDYEHPAGPWAVRACVLGSEEGCALSLAMAEAGLLAPLERSWVVQDLLARSGDAAVKGQLGEILVATGIFVELTPVGVVVEGQVAPDVDAAISALAQTAQGPLTLRVGAWSQAPFGAVLELMLLASRLGFTDAVLDVEGQVVDLALGAAPEGALLVELEPDGLWLQGERVGSCTGRCADLSEWDLDELDGRLGEGDPVELSFSVDPASPALVVASVGATLKDYSASGLLTLVRPAPQALSGDVCGGRAPCQTVQVHDAGKDAQGFGLRVVELALAEGEPAELAYVRNPCVPFEWWLEKTQGEVVVERTLLLEACNDGYGAAGMGEEFVEVGPNRFTWSRNGGSSWRWDRSLSLQLSPLRVLSSGQSTNFALGPNLDSWSWDAASFSGGGEFFLPDCEQAEAMNGEESSTYQLIPRVEVPAPESWGAMALGTCALAVEAEGAPAGAPSFSVMAQEDGRLVVAVSDDRLQGDTLEVWFAPEISLMEDCGEAHRPAQGWSIPLDGGEATALSAGPAPVVVERAQTGEILRLRLTLPADAARLSLVYRDGEGPLVLSTSEVQDGEARSLGRTMDAGSCQLSGTALRPAPPPVLTPGQGEAAITGW